MKAAARIAVFCALLLGLPLLGVWRAGLPVKEYLRFPPLTEQVSQPAFSWIVFFALSAFVAAWTLPLVIRALRCRGAAAERGLDGPRRRFPWWGWASLAAGLIVWALAWTRFDWFAGLQRHTFVPLWLAYIVTVSAVTFKRTGGCLMLNRPAFFLWLFPVSAGFWWFFEYLNRFVRNWSYPGVELTGMEYSIQATFHFATVLPAVLATQELIGDSRLLRTAFSNHRPVNVRHPRAAGAALLVAAAISLAAVGVAPDMLFPMVWIAPGMVIIALQSLWGERHVFSPLAGGDWSGLVSSALAALMCGFFWEMWNWLSLLKWEYHVPYVHRFQLFEMPLIGYAGYLPFGVQCIIMGDLLLRTMQREPQPAATSLSSPVR